MMLMDSWNQQVGTENDLMRPNLRTLCLGVGCSLVAVSCTGAGMSTPTDSAGPEPVHRVVDGDTFILAHGERIRLYAVDTPELPEPPGVGFTATTLVEGMLSDGVYLQRRGKDLYGRTLACAYDADGQSVDNTLLFYHLAEPWPGAACDDQFPN